MDKKKKDYFALLLIWVGLGVLFMANWLLFALALALIGLSTTFITLPLILRKRHKVVKDA